MTAELTQRMKIGPTVLLLGQDYLRAGRLSNPVSTARIQTTAQSLGALLKSAPDSRNRQGRRLKAKKLRRNSKTFKL
jgi:hypothetical protein